MRLAQYLTNRGNWLFKWRSFTPLLLIPLLWLERASFHYPLGSHAKDLWYESACFSLALAGIFVRLWTVGHVLEGTSGRNTTQQQALELNTTGLYSVVRNPLYCGNYLIFMGITLMTQSFELLIINTLMFSLAYLPIILREEEFLAERFGQDYLQYTETVPCIVPQLALWRPARLSFSIRMVLRREHDTWMSTTAAFVFFEHLRAYVITQELRLDQAWAIFGGTVFSVWLVLKTMSKLTGVLAERADA